MLKVAALSLVFCIAHGNGLSAQSASYTWSDIDCRQSPIVAWPGLTCRTTNVVTTEGNIGSFREWSAFGNTPEGYTHIFYWETQNSFSYIETMETTVEFLKWMFEDGQYASGYSSVSRYHDSDYATFKDGKKGLDCVGFRRVGPPQRGGYQSIAGGIRCAPRGNSLTREEIARFIDRAQIQQSCKAAGQPGCKGG
jgi:hypothetical protein